MKKIYNNLFKNSLSTIITVVVCCLVITGIAWGATTISTSISTDGNVSVGGTLSVTGATSLSTASTTGDFWLGNLDAEDDDYLYMDASSSEYFMWDNNPGQFVVSDDLQIGGNATATGETVFASTGAGAAATNTIQFGDSGTVDTEGLCLKFFSGGATIWCYFNTATGATATGTALLCSTASCE